MNHRFFLTLVLPFAFGIPLAASAEGTADAGGKQEIIKAWKEIAAIADRNQDFFAKMSSGMFADDADYERCAGKLEAFLKDDLGSVQKMLGDLQKYGKTPNEINERWKAIVGDDDPFKGGRDIDGILYTLESSLKGVERGRKGAAENLVQLAELELNNIGNFTEGVRPNIFKRNKDRLALALRFDPGYPKAMEWLAKIDDLSAKASAEAEKAMNDYVFPGHVAGFAGPGDPDALAKAALEYINSNCKPNEKAVAAVVSEKEWYCYKRNLFGEPTIWALTFTVAIQVEEEKAKDMTRVWSVSCLTEERPGVEKAPPFNRAAFNQSWKMRASKLPAAK